jgi:polyphosphate kinase 2 (PPK2 family)
LHDARLLDRLRVATDAPLDLASRDARDTLWFEPGEKSAARSALADEVARLQVLQGVLWGEHRRAVLVVLQGLDTSGKDGTIRHVFGPLNPQGVRVSSFRKPDPRELAHDFLWRIHERVPPHGFIGVFNRSHYEDVLVPHVLGLLDGDGLERRLRPGTSCRPTASGCATPPWRASCASCSRAWTCSTRRPRTGWTVSSSRTDGVGPRAG